MKKKTTATAYYKIGLLVTGAAALAWSVAAANGEADYEGIIRDNVPEVSSVERTLGTQVRYTVHTGQGDLYAVCDSAVGYQSRIETMTVCDADGVVQGVYVVSESETPVFFERLYDHSYFDQFDQLVIEEPIYLGQASGYTGYIGETQTENYVDAVSGSTVSSHAIAESVNNATATLSQELTESSWDNPYNTYEVKTTDLVLVSVVIAAFILNLWKKSGKFRVWWLLLVTVTMGYYVQFFLSLANLYGLITLQIPPLSNIGWYALMIGSVGIALAMGKNLYCNSICPFGAVQELINRVAGFKQLTPSKKVSLMLRLAAPTLLWIAVLLAAVLGDTGTLDYLPFSALFMLDAVWVMWILLPVILFMSLFVRRFYCQYFCPVGLVLNALVKWRNRGVRACRNAITKTRERSAAKNLGRVSDTQREIG